MSDGLCPESDELDIVDRLHEWLYSARAEKEPAGLLMLDAAEHIERLRRRDEAWAGSVRWHSDWVARAIGLLGSLRDELEHELTECHYLEELEQLLSDEFEDGEDGTDE